MCKCGLIVILAYVFNFNIFTDKRKGLIFKKYDCKYATTMLGNISGKKYQALYIYIYTITSL